jgi:hypothetical protein
MTKLGLPLSIGNVFNLIVSKSIVLDLDHLRRDQEAIEFVDHLQRPSN